MSLKITYPTLLADNEELNSSFEKSLVEVQTRLGQTHGVIVNGEHRADRELFEEVSPINRGHPCRPLRASHHQRCGRCGLGGQGVSSPNGRLGDGNVVEI